MAAARLARRPLLPIGVAEASDGLGGEAALSSADTAMMGELSGTSPEKVFRKRINTLGQEMPVCGNTRITRSELLDEVNSFKN